LTSCETTFESHLNVRVRAVSVERSLTSRVLVRVMRGYQAARAGRVSPCRFYPSCSEYAVEAVETHGAVRGSAMALRRLSRCRPFGAHGVDLVPPTKGRTA